MAKRTKSTGNDDALRIQREVDTWNEAFLRRFYDERREAILQSGDPVRIKLLAEHDERERNRQW